MNTQQSGKTGEAYAAQYLLEKGYTILCRNYRSRFGEIDLIVCDGTYICFVEVKTRSQGAIGAPQEWVDAAKQRRLVKTAALYLQANDIGLQPRFDVIAVRLAPSNEVCEIRMFENAYESEL